ncbi:MAG: type IX secretion system protein PorQ [Paludibacteraceae bacterium]|nr:type IX secretion system protein PorQ [Paludibacteraceae bacterium]
MKLRNIFLFALLLVGIYGHAQSMGTSVSCFLDFPTSAHVAALGGTNTCYMGSDATFSMMNPALLVPGYSNLLNLNYSVYMARTGYGSASYNMAFSDKDAFSAGVQFAHYGKFDEYDAVGTQLGSYTAMDLALVATYSRTLNRYFSVGVALKPILNSYADYNFFSLGGDLGLHFSDTTHLVAAGLTVRNVGGRIAGSKMMAEASHWLPVHVSLGVTKRFKRAPFALHFTLQDLQKWNYDYATNLTDEEYGKVKAGVMFARKIVLGVDVVPKNDRFWLAVSYNFDRGLSLANPYVVSVSGLSFGGGFRVSMIRIGAAMSFYGSSAVTGQFSLSMDMNAFVNKKKL